MICINYLCEDRFCYFRDILLIPHNLATDCMHFIQLPIPTPRFTIQYSNTIFLSLWYTYSGYCFLYYEIYAFDLVNPSQRFYKNNKTSDKQPDNNSPIQIYTMVPSYGIYTCIIHGTSEPPFQLKREIRICPVSHNLPTIVNTVCIPHQTINVTITLQVTRSCINGRNDNHFNVPLGWLRFKSGFVWCGQRFMVCVQRITNWRIGKY